MELIPRNQLIIGEIYTAFSGRGNVFCWGGKDAAFYSGGNRGEFCPSFGGGFTHDDNIEATPFEKAWLLEMKRIGKFIPENEFEFNPCLEYSIY